MSQQRAARSASRAGPRAARPACADSATQGRHMCAHVPAHVYPCADRPLATPPHGDHAVELGEGRHELLVDLALELDGDDPPVTLVLDLERMDVPEPGEER